MTFPIPYDWLKALHVISVIAWMAGMLYLPRLYVYHCKAGKGSELSETFKIMERRLLRAIINPAMLAAWVFGLLLAWQGNHFSAGWFHGKLLLLLGMQIIHAGYARWRRHFAEDANTHDARFYRIMNEVPTLLMIGIVILVIVKPF
ncbi:protoporphyrinogen oxidase HemJ [Ferrovibrio sp.]|uniref:protoporphyrinogen oxidase HemJ n=1 Tax=Ferrovibrio sp. TaxID=1917215 RepID=UPI001B5DF310|nr:protoporphyrinogen oxidase HemJ [Ferrovibrio sp.]MBP7062964.1 protoporphyrinogen oxidase HemJ [Ferrovibrio sp.]